MSRQMLPLLPLTLVAAGTVAAGRFVTPGGAPAGAKVNTAGVTRSPAAIGEPFTVDALGTAVVETGDALAAGVAVETDAQGRAVPHTDGPVVARTLQGQAATAAGQYVEVLLIPN